MAIGQTGRRQGLFSECPPPPEQPQCSRAPLLGAFAEVSSRRMRLYVNSIAPSPLTNPTNQNNNLQNPRTLDHHGPAAFSNFDHQTTILWLPIARPYPQWRHNIKHIYFATQGSSSTSTTIHAVLKFMWYENNSAYDPDILPEEPRNWWMMDTWFRYRYKDLVRRAPSRFQRRRLYLDLGRPI